MYEDAQIAICKVEKTSVSLFGNVYHNIYPGTWYVFDCRGILIGELFFQIFDISFAQFVNIPYFPVFFRNLEMLTNLIFLLLDNLTNSDRTPPYIDTYLQLFPNFWKFWKKRSPIRMSFRCIFVSV